MFKATLSVCASPFFFPDFPSRKLLKLTSRYFFSPGLVVPALNLRSKHPRSFYLPSTFSLTCFPLLISSNALCFSILLSATHFLCSCPPAADLGYLCLPPRPLHRLYFLIFIDFTLMSCPPFSLDSPPHPFHFTPFFCNGLFLPPWRSWLILHVPFSPPP